MSGRGLHLGCGLPLLGVAIARIIQDATAPDTGNITVIDERLGAQPPAFEDLPPRPVHYAHGKPRNRDGSYSRNLMKRLRHD